jgi:alpha-1,3-glucosyltransferase
MTGFASFLFGWHVHEKAILMVLIPMGLLVPQSPLHAKMYVLANITATYSLFPLLFERDESISKLLMWLTYGMGSAQLTKELQPWEWNFWEKLYLLGIFALSIYATFLHVLFFPNSLEFLPLLLTSVYCAIGMVYIWMQLQFRNF